MPRRPPKLTALPETLVAHPAELGTCLDHLAQMPVIAFDTEFVGEDAYRPELCLVQVATAEKLFVIDPFSCGPLDRFWEILTDPAKTVVVHAGREDLRICFFAVGKPPANVFDVQLAAGLVGYSYPIGYAGLVQDLLGYRMSKGETLTDWRRRPLLPAQLRYAFDDVRFLLAAWKKLTDRLRRNGRLGWADEEFAGFVRKAVADETTTERWRKVKGLGGLDRRGLAIVREVFGWREEFARRVNRPPRMLLRDDLIAEIARRAPKTLDDLQSLRGLPRGEPEAILDAVRRAKALPPDDFPELEARDNDPAHVLLLGSLLGVVLADMCSRKKLAANLVASGQDLKGVVRAAAVGQQLPDLPLTRGWRAEAILPELLAVLDGTHAVRVVKPSSTAPLAYLPISQPLPKTPDPEPTDETGVEDSLPPAQPTSDTL
ncbi:MAG: rnd [Gemmataceae bacterium]|nr:rnd [Gemmataceae bacterium]